MTAAFCEDKLAFRSSFCVYHFNLKVIKQLGDNLYDEKRMSLIWCRNYALNARFKILKVLREFYRKSVYVYTVGLLLRRHFYLFPNRFWNGFNILESVWLLLPPMMPELLLLLLPPKKDEVLEGSMAKYMQWMQCALMKVAIGRVDVVRS